VARFIASFFGSGWILGKLRGSDAGSGTVASIPALGIALLVPPVYGRVVALGVAILLGVWSVGKVARQDEDPGWVVIDEAAGTFLATIGLALPAVLVGWAVFRVADIAKRFFPGVAAAESLGGGTGIMGDDLVAGLYGLAAGWIMQLLTS
jgi:phosphatidylglycerophosphatase A